MTRLLVVSIAVILAVSACDQMPGTASKTESAAPSAASMPTTDDDKTFYAMGMAIAQSIAQFDMTEKELEFLKSGLTDAVMGKESDIDLMDYQSKFAELGQSRLAAAAEKMKAASAGFLTEMAAKAGAQSFDSGLIMIEQVAGEGAMPVATDKVSVHYHGTLADGKVFDSSVDRGTPASFALNAVVPCWTEALQKIKVGGKSTLVCPAEIAYGARGRPPIIPPGATLVFEVELLSIEKSEPAPAPAAAPK